jgi:hypothetical protein
MAFGGMSLSRSLLRVKRTTAFDPKRTFNKVFVPLPSIATDCYHRVSEPRGVT